MAKYSEADFPTLHHVLQEKTKDAEWKRHEAIPWGKLRAEMPEQYKNPPQTRVLHKKKEATKVHCFHHEGQLPSLTEEQLEKARSYERYFSMADVRADGKVKQ